MNENNLNNDMNGNGVNPNVQNNINSGVNVNPQNVGVGTGSQVNQGPTPSPQNIGVSTGSQVNQGPTPSPQNIGVSTGSQVNQGPTPSPQNIGVSTEGQVNQGTTPSPIINPNINVQNQGPQTGEKTKKKKGKLIAIIAIIVALVAVGIFVIYPLIFNTPQKVFNDSIDNIVSLLNTTLDNNNITNGTYDIKAKIDTNIDGIDLFNNYTYGIKLGKDSSKNEFEAKLYMLDKGNKEYSYAAYLKNSKLYEKLSSYEKLIDLGEYDSSEFKEFFETLDSVNNDDLKYLINKGATLLKENLNKNNFSKENTTVKVNEKEFKADKHSYKIDSKEFDRLYKCVLNGLYRDEKAASIITKNYNISKSELKEMSDESQVDNIDSDMIFNIYMNGNSYVGLDVTSDGEKVISYYTKDGNFDLTIGSSLNSLVLNGVKNGDVTDVDVKVSGVKFATLNVRKFTNDEMDLDYKTSSALGVDVSGTINYKSVKSGSKSNTTFKMTFKNASEYVNFDLNLENDSKGKVSDINVKDAVTLSDEELEKVMLDFTNSLENTPFGALIGSLGVSLDTTDDFDF